MPITDDFIHAIWNELRWFTTGDADVELSLGDYGTWNGAVFAARGIWQTFPTGPRRCP